MSKQSWWKKSVCFRKSHGDGDKHEDHPRHTGRLVLALRQQVLGGRLQNTSWSQENVQGYRKTAGGRRTRQKHQCEFRERVLHSSDTAWMQICVFSLSLVFFPPAVLILGDTSKKHGRDVSIVQVTWMAHRTASSFGVSCSFWQKIVPSSYFATLGNRCRVINLWEMYSSMRNF